jgi:hypothetical protein
MAWFMRSRFAWLVLLSFPVLFSSAANAQECEWEPYLEWGGQVFPSFLIATHGVDFTEERADPNILGDAGGVFGAVVVSPKAGAVAKLLVTCDGVAKPSELVATLPEAGVEYGLLPTMLWDFDKLRASEQGKPLVVTLALSIDGAPQGTKQAKAFLRSVNDCPYFFVDQLSGEPVGTSFMFAAYVNEDHPWIDQMLGEALKCGATNSFNGYQSGNPEQVLLQVFAVWKTLRNQGIKYSNITQTVGKNDVVRSQEVRFLDQSIGNAQANCVDGSVMIASFLRKIDIEAALVLVPGHCYLAFSLDPEGNELLGLETTVMGSNVANPDEVLAALPDGIEISEEMAADEDFLNFLAAIMIGTENLAQNAAAFEDPANADCELIILEEARQVGIMPIHYKASY